MSHRVARPLRVLQSSWSLGVESEGGRTVPTIAVYKPSGLPYFAASQVAACSSGRHLFSASPRDIPAVDTTDVSDSLLSRITDLLPPGSGMPRVALPLIHPALSRYATASQLNALTAQRKGTSLLACSSHEFMFLRNCHRLHLVRSVYRVLCRLPPCVSVRVRSALRERNAAGRTAESAFKNPYVQEFLQRSSSISGVAGSIPIGSEVGGSLPPCAYPNPLLQGGFISVKERCLLPHGTVSGYLTGYQLPPGVQTILKKQQRLKELFLPPTVMKSFSSTSSSSSSLSSSQLAMDAVAEDNNAGGCTLCRGKLTGQDDATPHPWIGPECRMRVALDVRVTRDRDVVKEMNVDCNDVDRVLSPHPDGNEGAPLDQPQWGRRGDRRLVGKPFRFDFRLVTLNDACELALYEVSTNNASDEEIKTAFAAANFTVINDFVNDIPLAEAMQKVSQELHTVPQAKIADLPMATQHMLREGSPLELVAEPLLSTPTALSPVNGATESQADLLKHMEQVSERSGLRGHRYRLLLETLGNLKDEKTFFRVAQLVFGSGLECTAIHFPDPRNEANTSAVQHLLLRMEEGDISEAYCNNVAERMSFVSRGAAVDCETYNTLLQNDSMRCLPSQREVNVAWAGGPSTIVRREECGELGCAYCGARGHVWSTCPEGVPLISNEAATNVEGEKSKKGITQVNSVIEPEKSNLERKGLDDILLTTVDDVTDALENATRKTDDANFISIPNIAPTQEFNPHAWRRQNQRPALHQHRLRCAYCSGKHHITQCPKLSSYEMSAQVGGQLNKEQLRHNAGKLFCIKCGKFGHLYDSCPAVPQGLHTATHCPICLQPHRKIHHEPLHCPRRVTPPQDYFPSGIPTSFVQINRSKKKSTRHGGGVLLSDSFLSHP
ncbi:hypothetical protein MOQ_009641 [Trypanosoma cruzi marinkellei]|uniref:CCHC-type domain-containing protein n=1 Tax=Trypanosoma cruzi marinkellei TaxID=85056 RepID=K2LVB4_TRYCR|nr:hypothetical protein MOQ_009641 [Trypanosoma cruzi marinkellei]